MVYNFSSFLNEAEITEKKLRPVFKVGDRVIVSGMVDDYEYDDEVGVVDNISSTKQIGEVLTNMGAKGLKKYGPYNGRLYLVNDWWFPAWNLRLQEDEEDWEDEKGRKEFHISSTGKVETKKVKKTDKKPEEKKEEDNYIYLSEIVKKHKSKGGNVYVDRVLLELKELLKGKEFTVQSNNTALALVGTMKSDMFKDIVRTRYEFDDFYWEDDSESENYVDRNEGISISGDLEVVYWTDRLKLYKAKPKPPKPESKPLDPSDANWWFTNSEKKPVKK
jgi:hypothetical protein